MVVDGMVTDQPGPYAVKLFWSSTLNENLAEPAMVSGAAVSILNGNALVAKLTETEPGTYLTDPEDLTGQPGENYVLSIQTLEGTRYESSAETLFPPGKIENVYSLFEENAINRNDISKPQDAVTFFVDAKGDNISSKGLTRWRTTGVYEVNTFPELRTKMENSTVVPDPVPCSGYINRDNRLVQVDTCICCRCWISEYGREAVVSENEFARDNQFNNIAVYRIPVEKWRFYNKYHLEVEQLSVSESVYEFWKRLAAQQKGTGSLFQPNAVKIQGNIRCVSDPGIEAFGVFSASAIVRKSIFIYRRDIPKRVSVIDTIKSDCRFAFDHAVNLKPPFW
jgi:hypothetical protein